MMRHRWDIDRERRLAATCFADGCSRTYRVCEYCNLTKITVIPPHGFPWREWITADGIKSRGERTPPCDSTVEAMPKPRKARA
jgi:hypothetical protein